MYTFSVKPCITDKDRDVYSGIVKTDVLPAGSTVYRVVHTRTSLEFAYAYIHEASAYYIADKFICDPPAIEQNFHKEFCSVSEWDVDN